MLMSKEQNEKLLHCPWIIKRSEGKVYYLKYHFDTPHEYLLLLTDLCLVWFEHGNYDRMKRIAERELRMDLSDQTAVESLLDRVKVAYKEKVLRCRLQRIPGHIKILLPLDDPVQQVKEVSNTNDVTRLSWVFDCELLDREPEKQGWLTGPQFIFRHFVLPSQTVVNYFTEHVLGELSENLRVEGPGTTYTQDSLEYLTSLSNQQKYNGASVSQDMNVEQVGEEGLERIRLEAEEREVEKRKRLVEEYNLKQQQRPSTVKKQRRI